MSLHVAIRHNGRYRPGTWFECFDDGCMQVEIETVNNRVRVVREVGILIPFSEIEDCVGTIMRRGLNTYKEKRTVKGKGNPNG